LGTRLSNLAPGQAEPRRWTFPADSVYPAGNFPGWSPAVALHIEDPEIDRLAHELADRAGTSVAEAVRTALRDRLERDRADRALADPVVAAAVARARSRPRQQDLAARLDALARECAALPTYDDRSPDEIIGYDEPATPMIACNSPTIPFSRIPCMAALLRTIDVWHPSNSSSRLTPASR
jgi:antitoxin VapB